MKIDCTRFTYALRTHLFSRKIVSHRWRLLLFLAVVCTFLTSGSPAFGQQGKSQPRGTVVAFVSDTQEPIWFESLALKRDRNQEATEAIFNAIAEERRVSVLFHLGDMTAAGSVQSEWRRMDKYITRLRDEGISFFAAPGNHEYFPFPSRGEEAFRKRFPESKPAWCTKKMHGLAVVLLNSNFSDLSENERREQQQWYEAELQNLDHDTTVTSIIVGTHHSPYTNSTVVDPSMKVRRAFVPAFLKSSKCRLFMSGHAHAFEHFREGGKDFLVIGGGGGLLQPLLLGSARRSIDLYPYPTRRRMFHYVLCETRGKSLLITLKMLKPDYRTFTDKYKILIGEKD
jgi:3',5'-cyclic AMP phosphodiesterase CpdA